MESSCLNMPIAGMTGNKTVLSPHQCKKSWGKKSRFVYQNDVIWKILFLVLLTVTALSFKSTFPFNKQYNNKIEESLWIAYTVPHTAIPLGYSHTLPMGNYVSTFSFKASGHKLKLLLGELVFSLAFYLYCGLSISFLLSVILLRSKGNLWEVTELWRFYFMDGIMETWRSLSAHLAFFHK